MYFCILFKANHLCVLKCIFKRKNIFDCSTTEFVDTLVIITDNADVSVFACKQAYKLILHLVSILILIDHDVLELISVIVKYIGCCFKKLYGIAKHIVKIHCVGCFKLCLIDFINLCNLCFSAVKLSLFTHFFGSKHFILSL